MLHSSAFVSFWHGGDIEANLLDSDDYKNLSSRWMKSIHEFLYAPEFTADVLKGESSPSLLGGISAKVRPTHQNDRNSMNLAQIPTLIRNSNTFQPRRTCERTPGRKKDALKRLDG